MDYIKVISLCFPEAQVYTLNNPTIYDDLVWQTPQIAQHVLDASTCAQTINNTSVYNVVHEGPVFPVVFNRENSAKNVWLSHEGDNSLPSNTVPAIIPWNCKLVAMTMSNSYPNADTDIQIWKAKSGEGSTSTNVHTLEVRQARIMRQTTFVPDVTFEVGDKIGIYLKDKGNDVKYVTVILYLQITETLVSDLTETFEGKLG